MLLAHHDDNAFATGFWDRRLVIVGHEHIEPGKAMVLLGCRKIREMYFRSIASVFGISERVVAYGSP